MSKEKIKQFQEMIDESENIVFFGGAGVSTESGIPDFRSKDGLYNQKYKYDPEYMLSHDFLCQHTKEFFDFYRDKLLIDGVEPNAAHYKLAALEKAGKLKAVVTQNIDGLHQAAGSKTVFELHGTTMKNYCSKCGKEYNISFIEDTVGIPTCECGGIIRPDVVLYGENLPDEAVNGAVKAISEADMLIIGGTSLVVWPAAGLIDYFTGKYLVIINKDPSPRDSYADLVITDPIGEVFAQISARK